MSSQSIRAPLWSAAVACLLLVFSVAITQARAPASRPGGASSPTDIVYSQPPSGGFLGQQSSQIGYDRYASDYDQYVWDNFTLDATQVITEIQWRGVYNLGGYWGGGIADFVIGIYTSTANNTQPDHLGPPLAQYIVGGNAGEIPDWTPGSVVKSLHDYRFALPQPFTATAGIKYWLQIEGVQNGPADWGIVAGSGGDDVHFFAIPGVGDFYFNIGPGDAAFTLLGPAVPISNLSATNDSPTPLGKVTSLTATIASGSNPIYQWDLGNGVVKQGKSVTFTYDAVGVYTAVVTASNSVNLRTATTPVTIYKPKYIYLPLILKGI